MNSFVKRCLPLAAALLVSCGFGSYDDGAAPNVTSSTSGMPDAGQWWPWVCPNGIYPIPATTPQTYSATGNCGAGGTFTLSVDGCEMMGNWLALGLDQVETLQPTSTPGLGGWIISAVGADGSNVQLGDGGTCEADLSSTPNVLTFTCSAGTPAATVCTSTLTPAGAP